MRARTVKSDGYQSMSTSRTTPNTISAIDKKTHSFKRRIQSQVLSEAGLKTVEGRVLGHVQEFVDYLGSDADAPMSEKTRDADGWGPSKNMSEACNFMTYNVISDLCYGESLDLFKACDLRWFPGAVALISRRVVMVGVTCFMSMSRSRRRAYTLSPRACCIPSSTRGSWTGWSS